MPHIQLFVVVLLVCVPLAWTHGGAPERAVATCFTIGCLATVASFSALPERFMRVELGVAVVDAAMLAVLTIIAIRADRAWPLAVAAFQLDIVAVHVLKAADAAIMRPVYAVMTTVWVYPQLMLLAIGIYRHDQRVRTNGADKSWSDDP